MYSLKPLCIRSTPGHSWENVLYFLPLFSPVTYDLEMYAFCSSPSLSKKAYYVFALSVLHINNPVNDFELPTSILTSIQLRADLDIFASRVKSSSPGLPKNQRLKLKLVSSQFQFRRFCAVGCRRQIKVKTARGIRASKD